MNQDLETAKELLRQQALTCAVCRGPLRVTASQRGVRPLLTWLEAGTDLKGASAADKVVGKAAAMLYCLLGLRAVHAGVISQGALEVLERHGIEASYDTLVPYIENRDKTGLCPMEEATLPLSDPAQAPAAIRKKLQLLAQHP